MAILLVGLCDKYNFLTRYSAQNISSLCALDKHIMKAGHETIIMIIGLLFKWPLMIIQVGIFSSDFNC